MAVKKTKKTPAKPKAKMAAPKKAAGRAAGKKLVKADPRGALEAQIQGIEKSLDDLKKEFGHFRHTMLTSSRSLLNAFTGFRQALTFSEPSIESIRQAANRLVDGVQGYINQIQTRVRSTTGR